MRKLTLFIIILLSSCSVKHSDDYILYKKQAKNKSISYENIAIVLRTDQLIDFRGISENNNSVNSTNILYSGAAGVGGFIAQLFTHSAISSNMQNQKLNAEQLEANKVLDTIQPVLASFSQKKLVHASSLYEFVVNEEEQSKFYLQSNPIFFFSQDLKQMILKHKIIVFDKTKKKPIYQNLIEVLSPHITINTNIQKLIQNDGFLIEEWAKRLYERSLTLAIEDLNGKLVTSGKPQKSFKFGQGTQLRVERGILVNKNKTETVVRNLRGWLIAYPKLTLSSL